MQFVRFAFIGGLVAVTYLLLYLLFLSLGFAQLLSNALAFLIAVAVQYIGQSMFTFGKGLKDRVQGIRFVTMIGLGLLTATLITSFIAPYFGLRDAVAGVIVTLVLPLQNYLIMSRWVFVSGAKTNEI